MLDIQVLIFAFLGVCFLAAVYVLFTFRDALDRIESSLGMIGTDDNMRPFSSYDPTPWLDTWGNWSVVMGNRAFEAQNVQLPGMPDWEEAVRTGHDIYFEVDINGVLNFVFFLNAMGYPVGEVSVHDHGENYTKLDVDFQLESWFDVYCLLVHMGAKQVI